MKFRLGDVLPSFGTVQTQHLQFSIGSIAHLRMRTLSLGRDVGRIVESETWLNLIQENKAVNIRQSEHFAICPEQLNDQNWSMYLQQVASSSTIGTRARHSPSQFYSVVAEMEIKLPSFRYRDLQWQHDSCI